MVRDEPRHTVRKSCPCALQAGSSQQLVNHLNITAVSDENGVTRKRNTAAVGSVGAAWLLLLLLCNHFPRTVTKRMQ